MAVFICSFAAHTQSSADDIYLLKFLLRQYAVIAEAGILQANLANAGFTVEIIWLMPVVRPRR